MSSIWPQNHLKEFSNSPVTADANDKFTFGPFLLEPASRLLLRDGQSVPLTPKSFDALVLLVSNAGRLVSKDDLLKHLWPDTFVDESNLTQTIFMLRKALGDVGGDKHYIVTAQGKGYRFEARVKAERPMSESVRSDAVASRRPVPWFVAVTVCLVAAALIVAVYQWRRSKTRAATPTRILLAVLPFQNLTGDPAQEYFSDGLTEEMIAQLGRADTQHLGVIGWTSVMRYKEHPETLNRVGSELGVQYVLEGGVRRAGDKVRITTELIQTKDQTPVWSREFDREVKDLLDLQADITQQIADEVELTIADKKLAARAPQPALSSSAYEAYDLCLRGRYFWNKRNPDGFRQAATYFQQAIDKDPEYPRGYTGLADTYAMMAGYSFVPASVVMPKAREAALKALQIDDSLAEAHTSLAMIEQNYDWDGPAAEKEFRRAIQLDPNYATAHHWYSEFLALQGRFDEALAESERARQLDPLSLIIAADNAAIFYFSRQYDRAIERFRAVLEMDPTVLRAHLIVSAYAQKKDFAEALADLDVWRKAADTPGRLAWYAYVQGRAGDTVEAEHAFHELEQTSRASQLDPAQFINVAYAGLGDNEVWLSWLEKVCREHTNIPTGFKVDPIYDPIRNDPRFQKMLAQVHFTQ